MADLAARASSAAAPRRSDGAARAALLALGRWVTGGTLIVAEEGRETVLGGGDPRVRLHVHDPRTFAALLRQGSVGLGRAYVEGWWDSDDLTTLLRVLLRTLAPVTHARDRLARAVAPITSLVPVRRAIDPQGDRRNIRAHYDLSNEFFELMLDETMAYSCAIFESPDATLAEASRAKLDRLCRNLDLGKDDHVVEIGTGWGSFAVHAATHYGCRITTTTISDAQHEYATRRVAEAGLSDRVRVLNLDYRELTGRYDKLVSIEMIEAIGWRQFDTFFRTCASLVVPGGPIGLQAIVIEDASFERAKNHKDFINQLVFPGGCLPSVAAMITSADRADLRVTRLEDIGRHYPETLDRWRRNLQEHADEVRALGLGERVTRLWLMYLAYCEAGFLEGHVSDVQMVLAGRA